MSEARETIAKAIWNHRNPDLDYDQWIGADDYHRPLADTILSALKEAGWVVVRGDDAELKELLTCLVCGALARKGSNYCQACWCGSSS